MSGNIKHVFVYDAIPEEEIRVNGCVVKRPNQMPSNAREVDGLRVIFCDDYETARAAGVGERIDAAFLNAADIRKQGHPYDFQLLGRSGRDRLEII